MKIRKSLLIIFIAALTADVLTKAAIKENVGHWQSIPVIDGFFYIVHVLNPGAAFGFLRNMDDAYRQIFFIVVTVIAIICIFFLMVREKYRLTTTAYALVLSGATGNLIDRINTGLVVDFLDFQLWQGYHWPAFNVADICITTGVALLMIDAIFFSGRKKKR